LSLRFHTETGDFPSHLKKNKKPGHQTNLTNIFKGSCTFFSIQSFLDKVFKMPNKGGGGPIENRKTSKMRQLVVEALMVMEGDNFVAELGCLVEKEVEGCYVW